MKKLLVPDMSYTYFQLRTKQGDGDVYFFIEYEGPSLQDVYNYIEDNELDINDFDLVKLRTVEYNLNIHEYHG